MIVLEPLSRVGRRFWMRMRGGGGGLERVEFCFECLAVFFKTMNIWAAYMSSETKLLFCHILIFVVVSENQLRKVWRERGLHGHAVWIHVRPRLNIRKIKRQRAKAKIQRTRKRKSRRQVLRGREIEAGVTTVTVGDPDRNLDSLPDPKKRQEKRNIRRKTKMIGRKSQDQGQSRGQNEKERRETFWRKERRRATKRRPVMNEMRDDVRSHVMGDRSQKMKTNSTGKKIRK